MHKKIVFLLLLSSILLFGGCIKDDLTECPQGLRLQFSYTLNMQQKDLIKEHVESIRVYIFDQSTGLLTKIIPVSIADIDRGWIDVDLPAGTYTISAWGGSSENLLRGGFIDAEMTNPNSSTFIPEVGIGSATLDNFRMMLACKPIREIPHHIPGMPGEISPIVEQFDDLFFSMAKDVEVTRVEKRVVQMDMIRDTNVLHIKVKGLQYLYHADNMKMNSRAVSDQHSIMVCVSGHNERYGFDNSIDNYAREVCYEPPYTSLNESEMAVDIKVLRLDIARFASQPVKLYILNTTTGANIIPPLDVINSVILKAKDKQGNLMWPNQEAIDRENEFPVEISILADLSVSITVNGFEIINTNVDISRPK